MPPRIQSPATHHVTNEGVPASLPCVASGVPTPAISWTKVGGACHHECSRGRPSAAWGGACCHLALGWALPVSPVSVPQESNALPSGGPHHNVSKDGTLVIARPSARDAGAYVCTATNAVGFSSQEVRLSVNSECRLPRSWGLGAWQGRPQGPGTSDLTCTSLHPVHPPLNSSRVKGTWATAQGTVPGGVDVLGEQFPLTCKRSHVVSLFPCLSPMQLLGGGGGIAPMGWRHIALH